MGTTKANRVVDFLKMDTTELNKFLNLLQREVETLKQRGEIFYEVAGSLSLTAAEAQKYLLDRLNISVTTATIHNWGKDGKITSVGSGRKIRYTTLSLVTAAKERKNKKDALHGK